jgi:hypothetical protein
MSREEAELRHGARDTEVSGVCIVETHGLVSSPHPTMKRTHPIVNRIKKISENTKNSTLEGIFPEIQSYLLQTKIAITCLQDNN